MDVAGVPGGAGGVLEEGEQALVAVYQGPDDEGEVEDEGGEGDALAEVLGEGEGEGSFGHLDDGSGEFLVFLLHDEGYREVFLEADGRGEGEGVDEPWADFLSDAVLQVEFFLVSEYGLELFFEQVAKELRDLREGAGGEDARGGLAVEAGGSVAAVAVVVEIVGVVDPPPFLGRAGRRAGDCGSGFETVVQRTTIAEGSPAFLQRRQRFRIQATPFSSFSMSERAALPLSMRA
ncbi:MAG: hypothetical protein DRH12_15220 [Deltaproteobacteria bacterium]|nr:MAG: hypothetical protein DRH12_15220 [Deltaproteobacteria bacterium]